MAIWDSRLIPSRWGYVRVEKGLNKRDGQTIVKKLKSKYGRNIKMRKDPNGRYEVWAAEYYKVRG